MRRPTTAVREVSSTTSMLGLESEENDVMGWSDNSNPSPRGAAAARHDPRHPAVEGGDRHL